MEPPAGAGGAVTAPPVDSLGAPRPPRRPRLAAIDLDGTLLDANRAVHPRSRDAVRAAVRAGTAVVLASGRMYRSMLPYARDLDIREPLICYQGAMVRAVAAAGDPVVDGVPVGSLISEDPLDGGVARHALRVAREHDWHRQVYQDDRLICEQDRSEAHLYAHIAHVPIAFVDDLADVLVRPTTKFICVIEDPAEAERCESRMRATLDGEVRITRSMPEFVEMVSPRASKSRALRGICERLGVALETTVAIGDAPNDVDMLEACGYAVAVRGGWHDIAAHADATCSPPQEGGVAEVLEALELT